jgi:hypothetical protein
VRVRVGNAVITRALAPPDEAPAPAPPPMVPGRVVHTKLGDVAEVRP